RAADLRGARPSLATPLRGRAGAPQSISGATDGAPDARRSARYVSDLAPDGSLMTRPARSVTVTLPRAPRRRVAKPEGVVQGRRVLGIADEDREAVASALADLLLARARADETRELG